MRKRSGAFRADPADSPEEVAKVLEREQTKREAEARMEQHQRKERFKEDEVQRAQELLDQERREEEELARAEHAAAATAAAAAAPGPVPGTAAPVGPPQSASIQQLYKRPPAGASEQFDYYIKVLLLGDSGVGKSSLMLRYADDTFTPNLISTAGVDFKIRYIDLDGKRVKFQIWDTAGQERFHTITKAYYKGAMGIVLVYDVTSAESFSNIAYWMANINEQASENVQKVIIGNKTDMPDRAIDEARGRAAAEQHSIPFFETSAKTNMNVTEAFNRIARDIIDKQLAGTASGKKGAANATLTAGRGGKSKPKKSGGGDCRLL